MNTLHRLAGATLLLVAAASYAAKPTSIVFETQAETADGTPYAQFTVTCNDGRTVPMTAWDGLRKWCIGDNAAGNCQRQQISAAKTACQGS